MSHCISDFNPKEFFAMSEDERGNFLSENALELEYLSTGDVCIKTDSGDTIWSGKEPKKQ